MTKQLIYSKLAKYYNLIYSKKDYKKESLKIKKLISQYKKSKGKDLLEVGCGTGNYLHYFRRDFRCTGVDFNQSMLQIAKKNLSGVTLKRADMTKLRLNKQFDVIICLFSSIGYVKTYANLKKTINNFSHHLKPGGVVIIEPWITKSNFKVGSTHLSIYNSENIKIARLVVSKRKGILSVMDMHYSIAERNKEIKHFTDRHELALFEHRKIAQYMKEAGLKTKILKNGLMKNRGLFVGVKQ